MGGGMCRYWGCIAEVLFTCNKLILFRIHRVLVIDFTTSFGLMSCFDFLTMLPPWSAIFYPKSRKLNVHWRCVVGCRELLVVVGCRELSVVVPGWIVVKVVIIYVETMLRIVLYAITDAYKINSLSFTRCLLTLCPWNHAWFRCRKFSKIIRYYLISIGKESK